MPIRNVKTLGDPQLFKPTVAVTEYGSAVADDIQDMVDTMRDNKGVGLAANQIGIDKRIIIIEVNNNPRYPKQADIPLMVLINPEYHVIGDEKETFWEGCLSLPGLRGEVTRAVNISYQANDHLGNSFSTQANGFLARVIQHECDHLDGILLHQRLNDLKKFSYEKNL